MVTSVCDILFHRRFIQHELKFPADIFCPLARNQSLASRSCVIRLSTGREGRKKRKAKKNTQLKVNSNYCNIEPCYSALQCAISAAPLTSISAYSLAAVLFLCLKPHKQHVMAEGLYIIQLGRGKKNTS